MLTSCPTDLKGSQVGGAKDLRMSWNRWLLWLGVASFVLAWLLAFSAGEGPKEEPFHSFRVERHQPVPYQAPVVPFREWKIAPSWPVSTKAAARGDVLLAKAISTYKRPMEAITVLSLNPKLESSPQQIAREALDSYELWERLVSTSQDPGRDYSATYGAEACRRILDQPSLKTFSQMDRLAYEFWMQDPDTAFGIAWGYRLAGKPGAQESVVPMSPQVLWDHAEIYRQLSSGFFREKSAEHQVKGMIKILGDLEGKVVGDWGCGTGVLMGAVATATGPRGGFVGADIAPSVLRFCHHVSRSDPRLKGYSVQLMLSAEDHAGFAECSVDIVHTNILAHLGPWQEPHRVGRFMDPCVRSIHSALRPGGVFYIEEHHIPLGFTVALMRRNGFGYPTVYDLDGILMPDWEARAERTGYIAVFPR